MKNEFINLKWETKYNQMNSHTFMKLPGCELKSSSSFNTALSRSGKTTPPLLKTESLIVEAKNVNVKKTAQ